LIPTDKYTQHLQERPNLRRPNWLSQDLNQEESKYQNFPPLVGRKIQIDSEGSRCNLDNDEEENFQLSDIEVSPQIMQVLERYFSRDVCHNEGLGLNLLKSGRTVHKNKSQDEAHQRKELENSVFINQSSLKSQAGNEGASEVQNPDENNNKSLDEAVNSPRDIVLNF
jgi:hypothetical protein